MAGKRKKGDSSVLQMKAGSFVLRMKGKGRQLCVAGEGLSPTALYCG